MKAIQVTCPNCGAKLRVTETSALIACEYCGTSSAIQRRTRILERVMPPQAAAQQAMRYAVQAHSGGWKIGVAAIVIVTVAIVGVSVWSATREQRRIEQQIKNAQQTVQREIEKSFGSIGSTTMLGSNATIHITKTPPAERGPSWQGTDNVLAADVDGDGSPELVGRGRQVHAGDVIRVLALDLATGNIKWQSEPLGTYSETYRGPLSIAGDLILFASDKGELQALALATGKHVWRARLDERVQAFCSGDAATVIAVGADDILRTLSRADGTAVGEPKPAPGKGKHSWDKPAPCALLPNDDQTDFERKTAAYKGGKYDQPGLDVFIAIDLPDGGKLLNAARKEGTRVTTLVALDGTGEEKWRTTASPDPLGSEHAARYVVAGDREACIIYYGSQYRIACFALADGKRLWDIEAPPAQEALVIVGRSLVLTTHRDLRVYDLDTGTHRWSLD